MTGEGNCTWFFREFDPQVDKLQGANDPIISKFKENFFNSLVRESIQNSMDAMREDSSFIEVGYDLKTVSKSAFPNLFSIKNHIDACKETHADNNRARELYAPMAEFMNCDELDILTISDFNTSGMPYLPDNIYKNPFQAFVNSDGQSVKNTSRSDGSPASNGGSFGIGKGAYFLMSPVRSLMVSTMVPDGNSYFEGVARLCTHDIDGRHFYHMGFYSEDGKTPVQNDNIPDFFRRSEVGTTISLVGKYADLGSKKNIEAEIEKAVITNFWLAIHNGKLIVTVGERGPITKESLETKIYGTYKDEYYKKVNPYYFYKAYVTPEDKRQFYKFNLENDDLLGHCELHVRLGDAGKNDRITCMRDMNMLIQTIPNPKPRHAGISATFLCLGAPGNGNLELTEDESHTSWSSDGKSGEAKKRANELLQRIDKFIIESIDSILGSSNEKFDITIDSITPTDEAMKKIEAKDGDSGNPFGVIRDEDKNLKQGFDRISIPKDIKEQEQETEDPNGTVIEGPDNGGGEGTTPVPTGRGVVKKRVKKKGEGKKKGKGKKGITPSDDTQVEMRFVPAYFDVAACMVNGQWIHTIHIDIDKEDKTEKQVFVDISVGAESGGDLTVNIKDAKMGGKKIRCRGSRVYFDSLKEDELTFDVTFDDNIRHTIKIG